MPMSLKQNSNLKLLSLCITILLLGVKAPAFASSCCAGSGGQSLCVLPSEQRYQFGISTAYRFIGGHFDPYGNYAALPEGDLLQSVVTTVGTAYRLYDDWQLGLSVPLFNNQNKISGNRASATALGDPAIEARYTLWEDLSFLKLRPQLTFYSGARLPLGKSIDQSSEPYSANAVGDGFTTLHAGMNVSKIYSPIKISFDASYFYPFRKAVTNMRGHRLTSPYTLQSGNKIQLTESVSYLFSEHWSSTLGLKQLWIAESAIDDNSVLGSAGRLYATLLSLNYFYNSSWGVGLTYETAFPFYRYLANQAYMQAVSVAAVYGSF
jgi:hypothetical protein